MATTPPPTWPIEPTIRFIVTHYLTDENDELPATIDGSMRDYNSAIVRAKELITNNGNVGVCTIQQVTAVIVYPSIAWEEF